MASPHQVSYVGGEMRNPARTIPRAIHSSMAIVMVSHREQPRFSTQIYLKVMFLAVNLAYLVVLDKVFSNLSHN